MARFLYTPLEWACIVLVCVLPLAIPLVWPSETFWASLLKVIGGIVAGFGVWLGVVAASCWLYERKRRGKGSGG